MGRSRSRLNRHSLSSMQQAGWWAGRSKASNTDIADEFTKLIVTQQAYSANTKIITTGNQMIQDLLGCDPVEKRGFTRDEARSGRTAVAHEPHLIAFHGLGGPAGDPGRPVRCRRQRGECQHGRATSLKNLNQVAVSSAGAGDSVRVDRSIACSINSCSAQIADGVVRRRLRHPARELSRSAAADLRAAGVDQLRSNLTFNVFTTAAQALATSPDSPSHYRLARRRAGAGATAQQYDQQRADAAQPGRPRHFQRHSYWEPGLRKIASINSNWPPAAPTTIPRPSRTA